MSDDEVYDYGELLVLQHAALTGPAQLVASLDGRGGRRPWRLVDVPGEGAPELDDRVRGLLVLGGPQSVVEAEAWVDEELALIRAAVDRGTPLFGICLGAQLLATALGGEVVRREQPEVVFATPVRTEAAGEDDVFAGFPDGAAVLLSHEDEVVRLPDGAVPMLTTDTATVAWRAADGRSYGVQFHPEVGGADVAGWAADPRLRPLLDAGYAEGGADDLVTEVTRRERFLAAVGVSLVGRFLDAVVGADDPTPRRRPRAAS